jgi:hypothetical protein
LELDGLKEALNLAFAAGVEGLTVDDGDAQFPQGPDHLQVGIVGVVGVVP